jgi:hypothetical protein
MSCGRWDNGYDENAPSSSGLTSAASAKLLADVAFVPSIYIPVLGITTTIMKGRILFVQDFIDRLELRDAPGLSVLRKSERRLTSWIAVGIERAPTIPNIEKDVRTSCEPHKT